MAREAARRMATETTPSHWVTTMARQDRVGAVKESGCVLVSERGEIGEAGGRLSTGKHCG